MEEKKKKDASAISENASSNTSEKSIPQNTQKSKSRKKGGRPVRGQPKMLSVAARSSTLAAKFYHEQLENEDEALFFNRVRSIDKNRFYVMAIKHDEDEETDGVWLVAKEKPHFHVIIKARDSHDVFRVKDMLAKMGVKFRTELDTSLLENRALETVGNYSAYSMYLTHDTPQAQLENKFPYDVGRVVSNLTPDEVKQIRDGFSRTCEHKKLTPDELASLDAYAFTLGEQLGDLARWYNNLNFFERSSAKMKTIRESYFRGVEERLRNDNYILRCCIYIHGDGNTGKTYTSEKTMREMGRSVLSVGGGGSGKFDNLLPSHGCILIDDDVCPNMLNMADNKICHAYRRNRDNPVWAGDFLIITSNLKFDDFCERCGLKVKDLKGNYTRQFEALKTRFFFCEMRQTDTGLKLVCKAASTRGTADEQRARGAMFEEFWKGFNELIKDFEPEAETVSFSFVESDEDVEPGEPVAVLDEEVPFSPVSNESRAAKPFIVDP